MDNPDLYGGVTTNSSLSDFEKSCILGYVITLLVNMETKLKDLTTTQLSLEQDPKMRMLYSDVGLLVSSTLGTLRRIRRNILLDTRSKK